MLPSVAIADPARVSDAILDVADPEGFVIASLKRSGIPFAEREREDLIAAGLLWLCELALVYEPQREGYAQPGSFAGYAAMYLPRKLMSEWHRMRGHRQRVGPSGAREWVATATCELSEADVHGGRSEALTEPRMISAYAGGTVTGATLTNPVLAQIGLSLSKQVKAEHSFTVQVALLRAMEKSRQEIAEALGADDIEVRMALLRLKRIGDELAEH